MATLTLTDFLLARIAEDEAYIGGAVDDVGGHGVNGLMWDHGGLDGAATRALAECEAKRRIVAELHELESVPGWEDDHMTLGQIAGLRFAVTALALPYADHPDYRESWRP